MQLFGPPNVDKLKAKDDVKGLIKALGYKKDKSVREGAAKALGEIGDTQAVEPLITVIRDKNEGVRQAAVEALDKLGWQPDRSETGALYWVEKRRWDKCIEIGEPAVKPLIAVLKDEESNENVRQGAVEALGQIGDSRAVELLIAVLEDKSVSVRIEAAKALGHIGDVRAVDSLIIPLKDEYSSYMPNAALEALVKIGVPAIEPLIVALDDKSASARKRAAEALGQIGDSRAVEPLIVPLRDKSSYVHHAAIEALVKIGAPAIEPLSVVLKDEDASVRKRVAETMGQIGDDRAVESLIAVLKTDKVSWVCDAVAEALIQIGDRRAVKPLIVLLQESAHSWVRQVTAKLQEILEREPNVDDIAGLYWISRKEWDRCIEFGATAIPILKAVIKASEIEAYNRQRAADALGQIGDACGIESLVALLRDRDWRVREVAPGTLRKAGWEPRGDIEQAAYWIANGDVNRLVELDCQAIKQLLIESMEWQMDPDDWHIKGRIAKLLVRPEIAANDSILARAVDELEICARKYAEMLDRIVQNPERSGYGIVKRGQAMFEDYADLIITATSYHVNVAGDGSGGSFYSYDTSSSLSAVEHICRIMTPISTNLLHHLSQLRDIEVTIRTFEVEYDFNHPSGTGEETDTLSFKRQRDAATRELAERGNPAYDLSTYKAEGCWRIPKH